MASTIWSSLLSGNGICATTTRHPACSATKFKALRQALYSWSVVRSSSPGLNPMDLRTVLTPEVAFGTKTRSSALHRTNAASDARAASSNSSNWRAKKWTGCFSSELRMVCWNSRTGCGQAPNEPWLRKMTFGSSIQCAGSAAGRARSSKDGDEVMRHAVKGQCKDPGDLAQPWRVVVSTANKVVQEEVIVENTVPCEALVLR